ncbi:MULTISPECIES: hypothetical protein [Staphylococcus]|uniref:hypothetical protein n=1 Tax=Staphylococcus TaxID=1279 RepID=UPI00044730DA|nr:MULTISPECIES: hypothetical protein [Staphylococcus]EZW50441.1 hypothetical protein U970_02494 [Staphylococcus aureus 56824-10]GBY66392.1 hypothetical protein M6K074_2796 [Staphylococcus aureus]GBY66417.1 hypothetical protein M6K074_2821 [Staphylococcus aureus]HDE8062644.1 hypothetical protein [Staphylococcus aureus]
MNIIKRTVDIVGRVFGINLLVMTLLSGKLKSFMYLVVQIFMIMISSVILMGFQGVLGMGLNHLLNNVANLKTNAISYYAIGSIYAIVIFLLIPLVYALPYFYNKKAMKKLVD